MGVGSSLAASEEEGGEDTQEGGEREKVPSFSFRFLIYSFPYLLCRS